MSRFSTHCITFVSNPVFVKHHHHRLFNSSPPKRARFLTFSTARLQQLPKPPTKLPPLNQLFPQHSSVSPVTEQQPKNATSFLTYIWPRLMLLGVAAIWGTNFPTVKLLQSGPHAIPISTAAMLRFSIAALSLAPFAVNESRAYLQKAIRLPADFINRAFIIGLVLSAGYSTQSISLLTTDANKTAFICSLAVVIVPLLQRIPIFPKAPQRAPAIVTWGAPLLAVSGVAMLELGADATVTSGDLWALLQAVSFGTGFLLNERLVALYPDLALSSSCLQLSVVAFLSLACASADASLMQHAFAFPDLSCMHALTIPAVLYAGVVTTALTVWLSNEALRKVSASELAVLLSTEPIWAAAFSAMLLGEHMGSQAVLGGSFILAACLLNQAKNVQIDADIILEKTRGILPPAGALVAMLNMFVTGKPDL